MYEIDRKNWDLISKRKWSNDVPTCRFEEELWRDTEGGYWLYGTGGSDSPYCEIDPEEIASYPGEDVFRLTQEDADLYIENKGFPLYYYFGLDSDLGIHTPDTEPIKPHDQAHLCFLIERNSNGWYMRSQATSVRRISVVYNTHSGKVSSEKGPVIDDYEQLYRIYNDIHEHGAPKRHPELFISEL